jgi:hypothetical protein
MSDGQRFCNSCQKNVTDLCGMSAADAQNWLNTHPQGACVRLRVASGALWAGALWLGLWSGDGMAASPVQEPEVHYQKETYIDGFVMDISGEEFPDFSYTLGVYGDGLPVPTALETIILHNPGPFRTLLEQHPQWRVELSINAAGEVSGIHLSSPDPKDIITFGPGFEKAFQQISTLKFPSAGYLYVRLVPI